MDWYYANSGQQAGPVSETEFQALVNSGAVTPQTLVWRQGMVQWRPYSEVVSEGAAPGPWDGGPAADGMAKGGSYSYPCVECGRVFPVDEMVRYSNYFVCATCKPIFFQRVREGVTLPGVMNYAGFWIRAGAYFIDYIILIAANMVIQIPMSLFMAGSSGFDPAGHGPPGASFWIIWSFSMLLQMAIPTAYETWFVGKYGATPGKMALSLKIVMSDGSPLSYWRAFGRYWGKVLSGLILLIGFIMAGFDDQKRALHDRLCDTRVIRK